MQHTHGRSLGDLRTIIDHVTSSGRTSAENHGQKRSSRNETAAVTGLSSEGTRSSRCYFALDLQNVYVVWHLRKAIT